MIDDADSGGSSTDNNFDVGRFIGSLDDALNSTAFFSKSRLTQRNIRGILKARSFLVWLSDTYGFGLKTIAELIVQKMEISLSADGTGREEIIRAIKEGTLKVEAKTGYEGILDRAFGGQQR